MAWKLHAIEQTQLRRKYRVDGVGRPKFDSTQDKADGQYKKTASNEKLAGLRPDFQFTPMAEGLKKACDWFCENYETCRK